MRKYSSIFSLLTIASFAACGPTNTSPDAATDDVLVADAINTETATPTDSSSSAEAGPQNNDAGQEGGTGTTITVPRPTMIAVSPMGHDRFFGVTSDAQGNFYAVGVAADGTDAMQDFRTIVAKFNANGSLDMSFGTNGIASHNIATGTNGEVARGIVVQPNGRIVVLATVEAMASDARDRDIALAAFTAAGRLDTSFGTNGVVRLDLSTGELVGTTFITDSAWGLSVYPDGRLLVTGATKRMGGTDTDFAAIRLTTDGARDMAYGTNGVTTIDINNRNADPRTSTILADGSAVFSGYMNDGGVVKPVLFKLTPNGQRDMSFGTNGVFAPTVLAAATEAYAATLQGTSFVTAGYGRNAATESLDWLSLRISSNGTLDTTYGMNGVARIDLANFNDNARSLVVLPDQRVLLLGGGRTAETNSDAMLALLTPNGQRDSSLGTNGVLTFDLGGSSDFFWGGALSPRGNTIAIVGTKSVGTGTGNDDSAIVFINL